MFLAHRLSVGPYAPSFPGTRTSCRFAEFSEHNLHLLMFGERDAAEQEGVGFRPGVLSAFRASEFGFALALHFHALAGWGGLPVELKSTGD